MVAAYINNKCQVTERQTAVGSTIPTVDEVCVRNLILMSGETERTRKRKLLIWFGVFNRIWRVSYTRTLRGHCSTC